MIKNGKILLLESVIIDPSLPKFKIDEKSATGVMSGLTIENNSVMWMNSNTTTIQSNSGTNIIEPRVEKKNVLVSLEYQYSLKPTARLRFTIWFYKKFILSSTDTKPISLENLKKFFDNLKQNVSTLDPNDMQEILNKYTITLENAKNNNQIALVEKITDYAEILKQEVILSNSTFTKYLKESDIVKFHNIAATHKKFKTDLCLTYIKNFTKIIPAEITKLKQEADLLHIFDNYVILHYDKTGQAVAETKAEIAKRKDPILFGVIKGSTNLYYIGDWIDDYCDLTLDVIIKKIGSANSIDNGSIIGNIQKI